VLSTAIIWGVIAKIANKMADMSPLINSLTLKVVAGRASIKVFNIRAHTFRAVIKWALL